MTQTGPTAAVATREPVDGQAILQVVPHSTDAEMFRASVEIAKRYPRDVAAVVTTLVATLDAFPVFAEKALYSIPYKDRRTGRIVKVEGMSIRAAETIASEWGNIRVGVRILAEDEEGWNLEAMAHDMQTNNIGLLPARALRATKVGGQWVVPDVERQKMKLNAEISKVKRNVTLSVIPLQVKAAYEKKVRELLAGGDLAKLADLKRIVAAITAFQADFNVDQAKLEKYVGKPLKEWLGADLADLRALYNALEDGETTVAELFAETQADETSTPAGRVVDALDNALTGAAKGQAEAPSTWHGGPGQPGTASQAGAVASPPTGTGVPVVPAGATTATAPTAATTVPPADQAAILAKVATDVDAAKTIDQINAVLGQLYHSGAVKETKHAALRLISAKRDALAAKPA